LRAIPLSATTNTKALYVCADDGGVALAAGNYRAAEDRALLTVNPAWAQSRRVINFWRKSKTKKPMPGRSKTPPRWSASRFPSCMGN
jgi:hypothetical protein